LANLLNLADFGFDSSQEVLRAVQGVQVLPAGAVVLADRLSNATQATIDLSPTHSKPAVAGIYQLDGVVRRAASLQMTSDARHSDEAQEVVA
jgi:NADH-quinone oxidoreductase subunit G